jgi:hypothetical protein
VLYSLINVGRRVNGALTARSRNKERKEEEEERKGGAVIINLTVGLTGFVNTRYYRYYSVELVYPYVDARS